ncbi:MAG: alpha/beta hydrolase [Lachnospiraceae bacterium]|nr:alpha/beta hydrolase [Lachnospiraceae bacterium]
MNNYPEIHHLKNNPSLEGMAFLKSGIVYSKESGEEQTLDLLLPWSAREPELTSGRYPLLVFVQGSVWTTPDRENEIPQLSAYAREGFAVATVGHRNYQEGHPFPAYLQDVKCAIRYLRKNADQYCIDPGRVVIWGTSSGGNTALLVGLTAGDPRYETMEYADYSDAVSAVVSCFGPTDMRDIINEYSEDPTMPAMLGGLYGPDQEKWQERICEMSPICHVQKDRTYPPFLLLHGDADPVVNFSEMVKLYHCLLDCGASVEAYQIEGGEHEGNFWSQEVRAVIREFLKRIII